MLERVIRSIKDVWELPDRVAVLETRYDALAEDFGILDDLVAMLEWDVEDLNAMVCEKFGSPEDDE